MLRGFFAVIISIIPLFSVNAVEKRVYPGAILSNRSTTLNEQSLELSARSHRFPSLYAERLASGAVHVAEKRKQRAPFYTNRKTILCRTAKVRRIIKAARGHVNCSSNDELNATVEPNDTFYKVLYAATQMAAPNAWDVTTGSDSLLAVVVDTGIDYNHIDLQANMWRNPLEIPNNLIDDDKNGYIDDVYGINAITNSGNPLDDHGHGTHVAGIIGAVGNNATGVVGVNWNVKLVGAKFLSASGSGSVANAIKAVTYGTTLRKAGYRVVAMNNSWGGSSYSKPLLDAIMAAADAGVLFVAAAGNEAKNNDLTPFYPASYDARNIIAVASTHAGDTLSSFSNYGAKSVHIAAPGSNIYSTVRNNAYGYKSGTSMASPQVAGVAILTQSACDRLDMAALRSIILSNGLHNSYLTGKVTSGSIVNATGSVLVASATCRTPISTPTPFTTPDPNATPTVTPTSTPTPTITPTPTATPGHYILMTPTRVPAGGTVTLKASTGSSNVNYGKVQITLYGVNGVAYPCDYTAYLLLTKGTTSLSIKMPTPSKYFVGAEFKFSSNRGTSTAVVEIENPQSTVVPYSQAALTCRGLTSQFT